MLPRPLLAVIALATASIASALPRTDEVCTAPVVRREWRELSDSEKAEYLRAAVCLRELPKAKYAAIEAVTTRMDDLVYTHFTLNTRIHFVANFLPWHRWFLQLHEDLLRTECGFTGTQPYWDWSIDADAKDTANSPVFDPDTGFGGNGQYTDSYEPGFQRCVVDGPFANTNLTLAMGWPNVNDPGNRLHCFTREFNNASGYDENGESIIGDMQASAYNSNVMRTIYGMESFPDMAVMLEGLPHAQGKLNSSSLYFAANTPSLNMPAVHSIIFGDMGPATSPNEPLFFLHHANVDRAWAKVRVPSLSPATTKDNRTNTHHSGRVGTPSGWLIMPASTTRT